MLTRYFCEYCGKIYRSKEAALNCEKRAKSLRPKFRIGEVVCDTNGYKGRIISSISWRKNIAKIYREKFREKLLELNLPAWHTVLYVLNALDPEMQNEKVCTSDELIHSILPKTFSLAGNGIMIEDEEYLSKK